MRCKKASLVINPRAGQNIAKLTEVLAILAAAGWKTNVVLKEYGGQTMGLATKAAEEKDDMVIGYGGDGTLSNVVNGVMNAKGQHSIVGVIPGGTANVWAGEVGIPVDPVKASLTLLNSDARKVDIGHVEVEAMAFPDAAQNTDAQTQTKDKKRRKKKVKPTPKAKHHFLLMAGLGIDAAIMGSVSKPLKYSIGPLAVGVAAAKELPAQKAFPIEIRKGDNGEVVWQGEALQVVIGNTRKYGNVAEMTPNAHIDDGILDICVITAGTPLGTMQQLTSLLLRRKPDNLTSEYFHGAHFTISAPASIAMQLDGSAVKLKDYLSKVDQAALEQFQDKEQVIVTYRFDVMPHALEVAIPISYDNDLFEHDHIEVEKQQQEQVEEAEQGKQAQESDFHQNTEEEMQKDKHMQAQLQDSLTQINALMQNKGRTVRIVGVARNAAEKETYVIAGTTPKRSTGDPKPVAVTIDGKTTIMKRTGEQVPPAIVQQLRENGDIIVEGKQSKRGVIRAKRVVII